MVVVEELAPELQIQLAPELIDPVLDMLGLELQIPLVVKACLAHKRLPRSFLIQTRYFTPGRRGPSRGFENYRA